MLPAKNATHLDHFLYYPLVPILGYGLRCEWRRIVRMSKCCITLATQTSGPFAFAVGRKSANKPLCEHELCEAEVAEPRVSRKEHEKHKPFQWKLLKVEWK